MPRSAKDIQLIELKDTIAKLNELISAQTKSMDALQKTIEDLRQELSNKQAEVDYLKAKLFGSSSEKLKSPIPGQMNLFETEPEDDRIPEIIEPEVIDVAAHKRERKPNATKEGLVAEIAEFLTKNSNFEMKNVEITNKSREITFSVADDTFTLTLVQKRKPKN